MSTNISTKLQSLLDEHKLQFTDSLYKEFSDINLDLNKTEQNNLYQIRYISTKPIRSAYNT